MTFKTHNDMSIDTVGTSLQGMLEIGYDELCKVFGQPERFEAGKIDARWKIAFDDGEVATIYNYKDGQAYREDGKQVESIRDWHIGGFMPNVADRVQIAIDLSREQRTEEEDDPILKALSPATEMMENLRATKGIAYSRLIEAVMVQRKIQELVHAMIGAAVTGGELPEPAAELVAHAHTQMMARSIGLAARLAGYETGNKEMADEIMDTADRVLKAESKGAQSLIKKFTEGKDD